MGLLIKTAIIMSCADFLPIPSKICMSISCDPILIGWKSVMTDSVSLLSIQVPLTISEQWLMFWLFFFQKHGTINFLSLNYFFWEPNRGQKQIKREQVNFVPQFQNICVRSSEEEACDNYPSHTVSNKQREQDRRWPGKGCFKILQKMKFARRMIPKKRVEGFTLVIEY